MQAEGGREGGRQGRRDEGRGMLAVPAGRDIPAAGAGERGRGPEAPSRGSCRTGTARVAASPRTPSRPPGSAGPGGEDGLEAAPPRAGAGTAGVSRGREEQPRSGAGHRGPLAGVSAAVGRCLEAAGTTTLRFRTRGRFAAPGNRSGSPSTNPVPVEADPGLQQRKFKKQHIHTFHRHK